VVCVWDGWREEGECVCVRGGGRGEGNRRVLKTFQKSTNLHVFVFCTNLRDDRMQQIDQKLFAHTLRVCVCVLCVCVCVQNTTTRAHVRVCSKPSGSEQANQDACRGIKQMCVCVLGILHDQYERMDHSK